ncbi:MAG: hypothetical protein K8W52_27700 [Deltaproteobacteria bacterium]|nr:hypothetical protein [Deltaproteobacteria bacterium]
MRKSTLRLRREVIRTLSSASLGAIAGGYSLGCPETKFLCPTNLITVCQCGSDPCGGGGGDSAVCPDSMAPNLCVTR